MTINQMKGEDQKRKRIHNVGVCQKYSSLNATHINAITFFHLEQCAPAILNQEEPQDLFVPGQNQVTLKV